MEKKTPKRQRRRESRPYDYEYLKAVFDSKRGLNITDICRQIGISRQTFYYILRGGELVKPETVTSVALSIGADTEKIFPQLSNTA